MGIKSKLDPLPYLPTSSHHLLNNSPVIVHSFLSWLQVFWKFYISPKDILREMDVIHSVGKGIAMAWCSTRKWASLMKMSLMHFCIPQAPSTVPGMTAGLIDAWWIKLSSEMLSLARKTMVNFVTANNWEGALGWVMPILKHILKLGWKYVLFRWYCERKCKVSELEVSSSSSWWKKRWNFQTG